MSDPQPLTLGLLNDLVKGILKEGLPALRKFAKRKCKQRTILKTWRDDARWRDEQTPPGDRIDARALLDKKQGPALFERVLTFLRSGAADDDEKHFNRMAALLAYAHRETHAQSDGQKRRAETMVRRLMELVEADEEVFLSSGQSQGLRLRRALRDRADILLRAIRGVEDTVRYHGSFAEAIDNMRLPPPARDNLFDFRSGKIPFAGRTEELRALKGFLADERPVLWWSIVAPGGSGKSRLALQLCETYEQQGWKAVFLDRATLNSPWQHDFRYPKPLLLVVDYASQAVEEVDAFLQTLLCAKTTGFRKIRLLLLEREGYSAGPLGPLGPRPPMWLPEKRLLFCYKSEAPGPCYALPPPDGETKRGILRGMNDALRAGTLFSDNLPETPRALDEGGENDILAAHAGIDPDGERPLYLIFIAEAWMQGKDIRAWKRDELLSHVYKREIKHLRAYAESVFPGSPKALVNCYAELWCLATASGEISGKELREAAGDSAAEENAMRVAFRDTGVSLATLLSLTENLGEREKILPLTPNIPGEYFVYAYTTKQWDDERRKAFARSAWSRNAWRYAFFLSRLAMDFPQELAVKTGGVLRHPLFSRPPEPSQILPYAMMLVNLTAEQDLAGEEKTLGELRGLAEWFHGNFEIQTQYAQGLFNLTTRQDLAGREKTLDELRRLAERFPNADEIQLIYAKGLVNLTIEQDLAGREKTLGELRGLAERFPDAAEIQHAYGCGLVNLTLEQDLVGCEKTLGELRVLAERFPGNLEIQTAYAKGLFNLTNKQDLVGREKTLGELRELAERFPGNLEIQTEYAEGLVKLTFAQDLAGQEKTLGELRGLAERFPDNPEIQTEYAKGLVNLTCAQDLVGREKTLGELRVLAERFPGAPEIQTAYANGLFNLTVEQDLGGREKTLGELRVLAEAFPNVAEIQVQYASGLVNLTCAQDLGGREKTLGELRVLAERFPDNLEIQTAYANGLFNLTVEQDLGGCEKTLGELRVLAERFPEAPEIQTAYAKGLFNLTNKQDLAGREKTLGELRVLAERFPDAAEIQVQYAKGLFSLTTKQDLAGREKTLGELRGLAERYPGNLEIQTAYANGLVYHTFEQDLTGCEETLGELRELAERFDDALEIQVQYVYGLLNLTFKQDLAGREKTLGELRGLAKNFCDAPEIQALYTAAKAYHDALLQGGGKEAAGTAAQNILDKFYGP
ncbi:MAG: hypothetical protein LBU67_10995 [Oscillospiraceae bacterium]|nr:hypothetical protein [Oscillospiraceae bacterium]